MSHGAAMEDNISSTQAFIHVTKAVMGAGSFSLPWAFRQAGTVLGPCLLIFTACLSAFTHIVLARCRRMISARAGYVNLASPRYDAPSCRVDSDALLSYAQCAGVVLGSSGEAVVTACVLFASFGVCAAYIVFICDNLCALASEGCPLLGRLLVTSAVLTLLVGLSWLRDFRKLAVTSLLGDAAILVASAVVVQRALSRIGEQPSPGAVGAVAWAEPATLPLGFGIISFLFCTQEAPPAARSQTPTVLAP